MNNGLLIDVNFIHEILNLIIIRLCSELMCAIIWQ